MKFLQNFTWKGQIFNRFLIFTVQKKGNYFNLAWRLFPPSFSKTKQCFICWLLGHHNVKLKWNFRRTKSQFWNIWPLILYINPWTIRTAWKIGNYCFDVLQFHSVFSKILIKEITFLKTRGCLSVDVSLLFVLFLCFTVLPCFSWWLWRHHDKTCKELNPDTFDNS